MICAADWDEHHPEAESKEPDEGEEESKRKRDAVVEDFVRKMMLRWTHPHHQIIIGSEKCISESVNLYAARVAIEGEMHYQAGSVEQFIRRIMRTDSDRDCRATPDSTVQAAQTDNLRRPPEARRKTCDLGDAKGVWEVVPEVARSMDEGSSGGR